MMPIDAPDDLRAIADAISGLLYPSESDEPFDLFRWASADGDARTQVLANARGAQPVTELDLDDFFTPLAETDDAARFEALHNAVAATLTDCRVFRIGTIRVDIYLIGKTPAGQWAGVHTVSVET